MKRRSVNVGHWTNRPGRLVLSWRDLAGKRRTREFDDTEDGRDEADQFRLDLKAQLRTGIAPPDDRLTFGQLADSWLRGIKDTIRLPTINRYASVVRTHLKPAWEKKPAIHLRSRDVMELAEDMLDHEGKGLAKGTVNGMISVVRAMYRWGQRIDYVTKDPTDGVARALRLGKRPKTRRPLTVEEAGRFLKVAPDVASKFLLHFHVYFETGARLSEALGIMDVDIEPENLTITLQRQVYDDGSLQLPKSEQGIRTVKVSAECMRLILREYADRRAAGVISPWLLQPEFSLPQPSAKQALRAKRLVHAAFKLVAKAANLPPGLSPHWLRHTYGTDLLAHGEDLARVSQGMGHSRISTTLNLYVEAIPKPQSTAADEAAERRKRAAETADMTKVSKFAVRRVAK